jgi:hypothetical protein
MLHVEGTPAIVCPTAGGDVCGIGIFGTGPGETKRILDDDPDAIWTGCPGDPVRTLPS